MLCLILLDVPSTAMSWCSNRLELLDSKHRLQICQQLWTMLTSLMTCWPTTWHRQHWPQRVKQMTSLSSYVLLLRYSATEMKQKWTLAQCKNTYTMLSDTSTHGLRTKPTVRPKMTFCFRPKNKKSRKTQYMYHFRPKTETKMKKTTFFGQKQKKQTKWER